MRFGKILNKIWILLASGRIIGSETHAKEVQINMIHIIADTHTHSVASGHAYSTITENCRAAAEKGLKFLAVTDHTPNMPGTTHPFYFDNLMNVPPVLCGINVIRGCEANIINIDGEVDLPRHILEKLELVIASMHVPTFAPPGRAAVTQTYLNLAENPDVDIVGHCGDTRFDFDHEPVIRAFAENGKVVEINSHSFSGRPGSKENCPAIAAMCAEYGVPVVVSTDAHFYTAIGEFDNALECLEKVHFPEELILNADEDRFKAFITSKTGRTTYV